MLERSTLRKCASTEAVARGAKADAATVKRRILHAFDWVADMFLLARSKLPRISIVPGLGLGRARPGRCRYANPFGIGEAIVLIGGVQPTLPREVSKVSYTLTSMLGAGRAFGLPSLLMLAVVYAPRDGDKSKFLSCGRSRVHTNHENKAINSRKNCAVLCRRRTSMDSVQVNDLQHLRRVVVACLEQSTVQ